MTAVVDAPPPAASPEPQRERHTARWIAVVIGVIALLFIVLLATRKSAESGKADSPLLGVTAPAIAGIGMDGQGVDLNTYRGKYVVVNFFASWCIPCQKEHPELVAFEQRHAGIGDASVLGVVYDDRAEKVRDFMTKRGGAWPVVDAPSAKVDWGVRGVPESFLVAPDGTVISHVVGGVTEEGLESLLREAQVGR